MRALKNDVSPVSSIRNDRAAAAANGAGVALAGYEGALAVLDVAALGGTTPTATYKLQESDDDSTYNDVSTADMLGDAQPTAFSAAGLIARGYIGAKKFLRWRLDALAGTSPTVTATGQILRGYARHAPAGVTQTP